MEWCNTVYGIDSCHAIGNRMCLGECWHHTPGRPDGARHLMGRLGDRMGPNMVTHGSLQQLLYHGNSRVLMVSEGGAGHGIHLLFALAFSVSRNFLREIFHSSHSQPSGHPGVPWSSRIWTLRIFFGHFSWPEHSMLVQTFLGFLVSNHSHVAAHFSWRCWWSAFPSPRLATSKVYSARKTPSCHPTAFVGQH